MDPKVAVHRLLINDPKPLEKFVNENKHLLRLPLAPENLDPSSLVYVSLNLLTYIGWLHTSKKKADRYHSFALTFKTDNLFEYHDILLPITIPDALQHLLPIIKDLHRRNQTPSAELRKELSIETLPLTVLNFDDWATNANTKPSKKFPIKWSSDRFRIT